MPGRIFHLRNNCFHSIEHYSSKAQRLKGFASKEYMSFKSLLNSQYRIQISILKNSSAPIVIEVAIGLKDLDLSI